MATATEQVLSRIEKLEATVQKSLTPIQDLLEKAKEPASKAGVSPEDYLRGQFKNGHAVFGDPRLGVHKSHRGSRRKSYLGSAGQRRDGQRGSFGELLKTAHDVVDDRLTPSARQGAAEVLKSYGTERWQYNATGDWVKKSSDMLESSAVTGGFLVTPEYESQLLEIAMEDTVVDKYARQFPMKSRQLIVNGLDQLNETFTAVAGYSNLAAGMRAWFAAEGGTRQQTAPNLRQVVLNAEELSFYVGITNTAMQDVDAIDSIVTQLAAKVVGWTYDYYCLRGAGVGSPLGAQNANCTITVNRATTNAITYTDICNIENYVYPPAENDNLVWLAHPNCKAQILKLNDLSGYTSGTGRLVFQPIDQGAQAAVEKTDGPQGFGRLLGNKLILTEKVPPLGTTGDIGLYDFSTYGQGRRMDIEMMWSPHVQFLQNSSVLRIVLRVDGQPLYGRKITYADAGTYASPFILLNSST